MKITSIFANKLFAFQYEDQYENELSRLLKLWTDTEYIYRFITDNIADFPATENIDELTVELMADADEINDVLYGLAHDDSDHLESFFRPLNNQEYQWVELSRQKGRRNFLRIYGLKIDQNCFVITGGAIKLTKLMQDREHTNSELKKLNAGRDYLRANGVFDNDSFFEFLIDKND